MWQRLLTIGLSAALIAGWGMLVWAQSPAGGGTGTSGFSASRFGAGGGSSSAFGSSGFGTSSFGGSRFGSSAFSSGGLSSQSFGTNLGGQSFVGRDSSDMQAFFNQMRRAGTQSASQTGRRAGSRAQQPVPSQQNVQSPVRVQVQVVFDYQQPAPAVAASAARDRLARILAEHDVALPDVSLDGETVVLNGVAANESQRLVLEKLIALEPGVRSVRNQMTVAPAASEASLPGTDN